MKAFIIENEYILDKELQGFKDQCEADGTFEEIEVQFAARDMGMGMLAEYIFPVDAIIVQSTWMYTDQLQDYLEAFVAGKLGDKDFYVVGYGEGAFVRSILKWGFDDASWVREEEIYELVMQLIEKYNVYEVYEDYDTKKWVSKKLTHEHIQRSQLDT